MALSQQLLVVATVRDMPGKLEAMAYCANLGADALYCVLEGDAGTFNVTPAGNGAVTL
jgi:hypothetical protein